MWFLNTLHMALNGTGKTSSSIVYQIFRGRMRQYMRKVLPVDASDESRRTLSETEEYREQVKELPFLSLALDLPPAPLYLDERMQNIIPQVPLAQLLTKFNGVTEKVFLFLIASLAAQHKKQFLFKIFQLLKFTY